MSNDDTIKALTMAILLGLALFLFGMWFGHKTAKDERPFPVHDSIYVVQHDTTIDVRTYTDTITKTIVKQVAVPVHDTTIMADTILVTLPWEEHHWQSPDTLDIWYSGFKPSIDSVHVHQHEKVIVHQQVIESIKYKRPILSADLGAGAWTTGEVTIHHADLSGSLTIGQRITLTARAGALHDGQHVSPFFGGEVRLVLK